MIYSLPRCGSTNFYHQLNACAGDKVIFNEPFNPSYLADFIQRTPGNQQELSEAINKLGRSFKGFKHVWHVDGWPFHTPELNQALLEMGLDVILLTRRNILQREVSHQMAVQAQIMHPVTPEQKASLANFAYQELDHSAIARCLRLEPVWLEDCRHRLRQARSRWIELAYEDLYAADDLQTRWQSLKTALNFVGIPCNWGPAQLQELDQICYPKINSAATYARIPGIEAIELLYGSHETGFLF